MKDPKVKAILGESGERKIIIHRQHSMMQLFSFRLTPDERYESAREPTLHFHDRKGDLPVGPEIPDGCEYCLAKIGEFRGALVFRY